MTFCLFYVKLILVFLFEWSERNQLEKDMMIALLPAPGRTVVEGGDALAATLITLLVLMVLVLFGVAYMVSARNRPKDDI